MITTHSQREPGLRLRGTGNRGKRSVFPFHFILLVSLCLGGLCLSPGVAVAGSKTKPAGLVMVPELELEGGRKLRYEGSVSSEKEVKTKPLLGPSARCGGGRTRLSRPDHPLQRGD
jgi:hypothetical protein